MEKINFDIATIIKCLNGEASQDEMLKLHYWLSEDSKNLKDYKELEEIWNKIGDLSYWKEVDIIKAKLQVKRKIREQSVRTFFRGWRKIAAILLLPLILISVYLIGRLHVTTIVGEKEQMQLVEASFGTRSNLILPDGTHVWLNGGSCLSYPIHFKGDKRKVKLDGEGYFEVVKNPARPFIVSTSKGADIIVTGTKFNLRSYHDENRLEAVLIEGKVKVKRLGQEVVLHPKDKCIINDKDGSVLMDRILNEDDEIAWHTGKLVFRYESLEEVALRLERWYNVKIDLSADVKQYHYSAIFTNESFERVLELLKLSAPINYRFVHNEKKNAKYKTHVLIWKNI